jgi:hypothetical protein
MKKLCIMAFVLALMVPMTVRTQSREDKEAVRQAVLDYVEGVYEVAPARIERSVHPELAKRGFWIKKGEASYTGGVMTFAELVKLAGNYKLQQGWSYSEERSKGDRGLRCCRPDCHCKADRDLGN